MKIQLSAFSTKGPRKTNQDRYYIININNKLKMAISMKKVILFLLIAILCGCEDKIDNGIILEKKHNQSYQYCQPLVVGKSVMSIPISVPESYTITFKNGSSKRVINVSKTEYDKYSIGDSFHIKK